MDRDMGHEESLKRIQVALDQGGLTPEAFQNLKRWLIEPDFAPYQDELHQWIAQGKFDQLQDCFYTTIPFGTGGRRGPMGIGPNRINFRTIGESAQGVAQYLRALKGSDASLQAVIAYDTRHYSPEFATATAEILAASGFTVYLFEGFRATPELSLAVRELQADVGIVISASHNPPSDNGFKVFWADGEQILPPHDEQIIEEVNRVGEIRRLDWEEAQRQGLGRSIGREIDEKYWAAVCQESVWATERGLRIVYTPLHGTGMTSVWPVLQRMGYGNLHLVSEQAEPQGDFPHVKDHAPNPENPAAMEQAIALARDLQADLVLATDPDADRLGVAVPASLGGDRWVPLTGNQIGSLLCYFILKGLTAAGRIPRDGVVVKTLVTTELMADIAARYGVRVQGDLLVGFKYIAEVIGSLERPEQFIFGTEESHGFLKGSYARDKDGAVAALLMAELTEYLKQEGYTPVQFLDEIYREYGYYQESQVSFVRKGFEGQRQIARIMERLRTAPPTEIAGLKAVELRDYLQGEVRDPASGQRLRPIERPRGDLIVLTLSQDGRTRLAARPSGTEPKIKFYISAYASIPEGAGKEELAETKGKTDALASAIAAEIFQLGKEGA
ncbi:MAG: phospho-sugar mutase [Candidatus Tectomicrobia bacterium]|uniref:Phospho-sugar mutase n=1 Tax=Tectimicrobiota bacterium TaxID=2528274 RepID=A0A932FU86_UNCTE|nr:phospho-sugar mutase [Candidatus Tectomicrobia bacterium]